MLVSKSYLNSVYCVGTPSHTISLDCTGYDGKIDGGTTIKTHDCRSEPQARLIVVSVMGPAWVSC